MVSKINLRLAQIPIALRAIRKSDEMIDRNQYEQYACSKRFLLWRHNATTFVGGSFIKAVLRKRISGGAMRPIILSHAQYQRAVLSSGKHSAFTDFSRRRKLGLPIIYGAIGGSITEGACASRNNSFSEQLSRRLGATNSIRSINAGLGASNSLFGTFRAQQDLLRYRPNLITIDFSVNDSTNPDMAASYEALIRQCLSQPQQPLVILLFCMHSDGTNCQGEHAAIGRHYDLPMLSYRDALWPDILSGALTWRDISPDDVHPNDAGHGLVAEILYRFLDSAARSGEDNLQVCTGLPMYYTPTAANYEQGRIIDAYEMNTLKRSGWRLGPHKGGYCGWHADTPGAELTVTFSGKSVFLGYKQFAGASGRISCALDGGEPVVIDGFYEKPKVQVWAGGHTMLARLGDNLHGGEHTLKVRLLSEIHPQSTGHSFDFGYLLVS